MYQTRDELLNMLANSREPLKALQKNKRKINKLEKRIHKRLYLLFALITLGPLVLMYFIDAQRGNIIEAIRYGLMPSIIPGFDMIYLILNFALVILFFSYHFERRSIGL